MQKAQKKDKHSSFAGFTLADIKKKLTYIEYFKLNFYECKLG
jgi:hypothetical protein